MTQVDPAMYSGSLPQYALPDLNTLGYNNASQSSWIFAISRHQNSVYFDSIAQDGSGSVVYSSAQGNTPKYFLGKIWLKTMWFSCRFLIFYYIKTLKKEKHLLTIKFELLAPPEFSKINKIQ